MVIAVEGNDTKTCDACGTGFCRGTWVYNHKKQVSYEICSNCSAVLLKEWHEYISSAPKKGK